jgi:hypothetical protein
LSAVFFIFLRRSSSGNWRGQDESTLQGAERRNLRTTANVAYCENLTASKCFPLLGS